MDITEFEEFSVPIPSLFYSTQTGMPFMTCSKCSVCLADGNNDYYVHKHFQNGNVIFESAICGKCHNGINPNISKESIINQFNYCLDNINMRERIRLINSFDNLYQPWIERCIFKNIRRKECRKYMLIAQCRSDQLIISFFPVMVSLQAMKELRTL